MGLFLQTGPFTDLSAHLGLLGLFFSTEDKPRSVLRSFLAHFGFFSSRGLYFRALGSVKGVYFWENGVCIRSVFFQERSVLKLCHPAF